MRPRLVLARGGLLALGALAGLALLVLLELALWLLGLGDGPPAYDPFAGFSGAVPFFERAARDDGTPVFRVSPVRFHDAASRADPQPEREFLAEKPPGGFRVFVVGGSSAAGFPYPASYAFGAWLERRLRAGLPDLTTEVVNAAVAGYSTRRVLVAVREIARHEPDLLVVYAGHNEWAERRYYSRLLEMDPRLFRLRERLFSTRLFTVLSRLRPSSEDPERRLERYLRDEKQELVEMFAVFSSRVEGRDYASPQEVEQRDALYRANLEEIVRTARGAGARVALLTLSQNFADWAPGASTHREGLDAGQERAWQALADEGDRVAAAGDCRAALTAYRRALGIDDAYASLHYRIAQCARELGELGVARDHYRRASDLDRVPYGAPLYFNDVLREIAEAEGLILVETERALAAASPGGLVGDDLFVEFAHPNLRAHQRIAADLASSLRRAGVPRSADRWRDAGYADPDPASLYAAFPELRAREHRAIQFACTVARRRECADAHRRRLAELGTAAPRPVPPPPES